MNEHHIAVEAPSAVQAQWLRRTNAEDVLNEMLIDHEDALNAAFETGDPLAVGRLVLEVRMALALRYAKRWGEEFGACLPGLEVTEPTLSDEELAAYLRATNDAWADEKHVERMEAIHG